MIAHLNGTVAGVGLDGAVIEVGGVGLRVQCTPDTLATLKPGELARVATTLVVREDSLTLFGVATDDERTVVELQQPASGVGPPLARRAAPSWRDQVMTGLVNLGWSARDAEAAVAAVEADSDGQAPDVATALRAALRKLSKS